MPVRPTFPDSVELPSAVNGWRHDPEATRNAHLWRNEDGSAAVGIYPYTESTLVKVDDPRAKGLETNVTILEVSHDGISRKEANRQALCAAVEWMEETDPMKWQHPDILEAVFTPPAGFSLEAYYLDSRTATIYYKRDSYNPDTADIDYRNPKEWACEEVPYLYVHVWRGSGKATVAAAPWTHAHGPGDKHWEVEPVAEPPEDCGLEVALSVAR